MPTTALKLRSLSAAMTVSDLAKTLKLYQDGLGFTVGDTYKDDAGKVRGYMLDAGGFGFGISQDDFSKGRDRVKGLGMRLYLETDQDVTALAASAKAAGFRIDHGPAPMPWGPMGFSATDPDGYQLTITNPE